MTRVGNLTTNLGGYLEVYLIRHRWGNLDANLGGYFEFSFIMTKSG